MTALHSSPAPLPDAPYRGIRPFRFVDQQIFVARDEETWDLLSKVTLYRAILLYGNSGAGKSSLISAGLVPQALKENFVPDRIRIQPFPGREIRIERMLQSDGSRPIFLPSNFHPVGEPDDYESESFELSLVAFRQQLKLSRKIRSTTRSASEFDSDSFFLTNSPRPLLIFDQFEEFITLFEEAQRGGHPADAKLLRKQLTRIQTRILVTLVKMIRDHMLPVKIVFSFREDYLAKLNRLFEYCPELLDQGQRLISPHVDVLPKIIRAPFEDSLLREHFLQREDGYGSELKESIAQRIAADLGRRSDSDLVYLSELQIVCLLLWRSPNPEALYNERSVEGLLEDYGRGVVGQLPAQLQDKAVAILAEMLTASNTRNIVSGADLLVSAQREKLSIEQFHQVLDALCNNQIVRRERHRELYVYELASEYLIPWINRFATDRTVLQLTNEANAERQHALQFQRLLRNAKFWQALSIGVAIAVVLLTFLGAYLYWTSVKAGKELAQVELARAEGARKLYETEQQKLLAEGKVRLADQQREKIRVTISIITGKDDAKKLDAIEQLKKWTEEGELPPEVLLLLVAAQSTTENLEVRRAASQVLSQAAQADANLSESIGLAAEADSDLAAKLPLMFNIYLADETQRSFASKIASTLRQHGYLVSSTAPAEGDPPNWDNEIRFFRRPEKGQPQPADIVKLLKNTTGTNWKSAYNPQYANTPRGRAGQWELWFAQPAGQLVLGFIDEDGKTLQNLTITLNFNPTGDEGAPFKSHSTHVTVPHGEYDVTISVKDYKDLRRSLSMEAGKTIDWLDLKLTKEKAGPQSGTPNSSTNPN